MLKENYWKLGRAFPSLDHAFSCTYKVHIFWEDHKFLQNLHFRFVLCISSQIYSEDFIKCWRLLRIYELYLQFGLHFGLHGLCDLQDSRSTWPGREACPWFDPFFSSALHWSDFPFSWVPASFWQIFSWPAWPFFLAFAGHTLFILRHFELTWKLKWTKKVNSVVFKYILTYKP